MRFKLIILLLFLGVSGFSQFSPLLDTVRFYRGTAVGSKIYYLHISGDTLFLNADTLYTGGVAADSSLWQMVGTEISPKTGVTYVGIGTTDPSELLELVGGNFEIGNGYKIIQNDTNLIRRYKTNWFIGSQNTSLTTGVHNVFIGYSAGQDVTSGYNNIAIGTDALDSITTGANNIAIGWNALQRNKVEGSNIAIGYYSQQNSYGGSSNVSLGQNTLGKLSGVSSSDNNTAIGSNALSDLIIGKSNTVIGRGALDDIDTGDYNVVVGAIAGGFIKQSGSRNVFLGYNAGGQAIGNDVQTKSGNIAIGYEAGYNDSTDNKLYIENSNSATPLIYGDFAEDSVVIYGKLTATAGFALTTGATNGHVLTSDANGVATWQAAASATSWQHELAADAENNWTVSFTLKSGSVVSYNGDELPAALWSGSGTTTLNLTITTYKYDKITVIQ